MTDQMTGLADDDATRSLIDVRHDAVPAAYPDALARVGSDHPLYRQSNAVESATGFRSFRRPLSVPSTANATAVFPRFSPDHEPQPR
jgi:hypothetical protein